MNNDQTDGWISEEMPNMTDEQRQTLARLKAFMREVNSIPPEKRTPVVYPEKFDYPPGALERLRKTQPRGDELNPSDK